MKERNKGVEEAYSNIDMDYYYSTSEYLPCKKHPSSSSSSACGGGICAYCLKERLVKLVCSDCGEQRLSSCSCSDEITSNRNSCSVEVGSVGRVSFLIENEKNETNPFQHLVSKAKNMHQNKEEQQEQEEPVVLKRSSSSNHGFWRIGKLFMKKKNNNKKDCGFDEKGETWMMGVSRSRSLCSFRGGGIFGSEDGNESRSSISAARSSGVNGGLILESGRRSGCYSEAEPRRSGYSECENVGRKSGIMENDGIMNNGVMNRRVFSLRESDFKGMDESSFIDLKIDYSSSESRHDFGDAFSGFGSVRGGNSCRMNVNERGIKRGRKSNKGWRWIFRYNSNWGNSRKRDQDLMFKT